VLASLRPGQVSAKATTLRAIRMRPKGPGVRISAHRGLARGAAIVVGQLASCPITWLAEPFDILVSCLRNLSGDWRDFIQGSFCSLPHFKDPPDWLTWGRPSRMPLPWFNSLLSDKKKVNRHARLPTIGDKKE
jgi:hypothetical protein